MNFRFTKAAILAMGLALASNSHATTYNFSETILGVSVTGSFNGIANGNFITGISNVSVVAGGTALIGLVADGISGGSWTQGAAVVTFNGVGNNFLFIDNLYSDNHNALAGISIPIANGQPTIFNNEYYNTYPAASALFASHPGTPSLRAQFDNGSLPTNWSVTAAVSAVPEAEEWAMMLLGLPLIGWAVRRKQEANSMAAFA